MRQERGRDKKWVKNTLNMFRTTNEAFFSAVIYLRQRTFYIYISQWRLRTCVNGHGGLNSSCSDCSCLRTGPAVRALGRGRSHGSTRCSLRSVRTKRTFTSESPKVSNNARKSHVICHQSLSWQHWAIWWVNNLTDNTFIVKYHFSKHLFHC